MKKIILFFLLFAGVTQAQYDPFIQTDTIVRAVQTYYADTIDLKTGNKSVYIQNNTGGTLRVAFNTGTNTKDSVNFTSVPNGQRIQFYQMSNRYMYLKSTISGTALITVKYGYGIPYEIVPQNSSGEVITSMPSNLATIQFNYVDTVTQARDTVSRQILANSNTLADTFKVWVRLTFYAIGDSILEVSTSPTFPTNKTTRIKGGGRWTTERLNIANFPNFYIRKRFSGVGEYEVIVEGQ